MSEVRPIIAPAFWLWILSGLQDKEKKSKQSMVISHSEEIKSAFGQTEVTQFAQKSSEKKEEIMQRWSSRNPKNPLNTLNECKAICIGRESMELGGQELL